MTVERFPLNLQVRRTSPIKVSGVNNGPAGYQIFNRNLTCTVWASSNPAVADGNATPIAPGTIISWTNDLDVWLILGNDDLTVPLADVVITYDARDLNPAPAAVAAAILNAGVLIIDKPVTLYGPQVNLAAGVSSPIYDVSRFNSIYVDWFNNGAGTWSGYVEWFADAAGLNQIGQHVAVPSANPQRWRAWIPVRGSYVRFTNNGTGAVTFTAIASFRQIQNLQQFPPQVSYLTFWTGNIPIAGSQQVDIPPWFGDVEIDIYIETPTVAATLAQYSVIDPALNIIRNRGIISSYAANSYNPDTGYYQIGGSSLGFAKVGLSMWGVGQRLIIFNAAAAALPTSVLVMPRRKEP